ncbi:MAG: hypothetical protein ACJAQT_000021 [Akkermansiaceae bacterium]|jgi:hypothetical protein
MSSRSHLKTIIVALVWAFMPLGASAETKEVTASDAELPAWVSNRIAALQPRPEEKCVDLGFFNGCADDQGLLRICFWRESFEVAFGSERRGLILGLFTCDAP